MRAASALAREWEVLGRRDREGGEGMGWGVAAAEGPGQDARDLTHSANVPGHRPGQGARQLF